MSVALAFSDIKYGWAKLRVSAGDCVYVVDPFSYTTFAFEDVVRMAVDVALGAPKAEVILDGEPIGWALRFEQTFNPRSGSECAFHIDALADASYQETARSLVFSAEVERDAFARAVREAMTGVEQSLGIDVFEAAWLQPYPNRAMAALDAALATKPRRDIAFAGFEIDIESPLQDDVRALVRELNEWTLTLTPAEHTHHMSVEQMAQDDTTLFVARSHGEATAMGALRRHPGGVGEVKRMFTRPAHQGRGLGRAILAKVEAQARAEGCTRLVLETGSNFEAAQHLYRSAGFAPCGPVLDYAPSPWTAFFAKDLTA
ncbi:MAG: GNAT family N-acetyltransferase [Hyphomonadaceae bacterium]|nr:GNAT family N-acetyltransferase [Hyphomonadaceae bacterium]